MKNCIAIVAVAVLVFALAPAAQAEPVALASDNVTYSGQTITSIDGMNFNIEAPASFVVTTWDGITYIKDTGVNLATYRPTDNHTLTSAEQTLLTDLDIDTGWGFNDSSESLIFESNITTSITASIASQLNEVVLILFDSGGNDGPTVQAFNDTTALGSAITIVDDLHSAIPAGGWGDTGGTSYSINNAAGHTSVAVGLSLADLGVPVGQPVTKFVFTTVGGWDATQIVVDSNLIPEPATMSVLAIGGLALLRRRKRA
jgi:hypothetical protein